MEKTTQEQIDEINAKLDKLIAQMSWQDNPSSMIFKKKVFFDGAVDLSTESLIIGSATGSLGFYGETPVSQASAISAPSTPSAAYSQAEAQSAVNAINAIRVALSNIGLTA